MCCFSQLSNVAKGFISLSTVTLLQFKTYVKKKTNQYSRVEILLFYSAESNNCKRKILSSYLTEWRLSFSFLPLSFLPAQVYQLTQVCDAYG